MASSIDGTKLAAAEKPGHIYLSTDSGATWTVSEPTLTNNWIGLAISSDEKKIVAMAAYQVFTNTLNGIEAKSDAQEKVLLKGLVTVKKLSSTRYTLIVSSNAPKTAFVIAGKKKGSKSLSFSGITNSSGSTSLNSKGSPTGYAFTVQFPAKN